jgi:hypothetical protein
VGRGNLVLAFAICAIAALAAAPPIEAGTAPGSKCAGGPGCSTLPPPAGVYTGSDKAGVVRFTLSEQATKGQHASAALVIRGFSFANMCAGATRVTHAIPVGPHFRFTLKRAGITLTGSFVRIFTGALFQKRSGVAKGTARVHTAGCDSGTLPFQVQSG